MKIEYNRVLKNYVGEVSRPPVVFGDLDSLKDTILEEYSYPDAVLKLVSFEIRIDDRITVTFEEETQDFQIFAVVTDASLRLFHGYCTVFDFLHSMDEYSLPLS